MFPLVTAALLAGGVPATACCERSADKRPVVLVHGWMSSSLVFRSMEVSLRQAGYPVHVIDLPGHNIRTNAMATARLIDGIATTRRGKVHVVGHSMGGLSNRHYIKSLGGAARVEHYVSMGSPQYGSKEACLLSEDDGGQMCHTGQFIAELNAGDDTPGSVRYTTIRSTLDVPPSTNRLDGGACFHDIADVPHSIEPVAVEFIAAVLATLGGTCPGRFVTLPSYGAR